MKIVNFLSMIIAFIIFTSLTSCSSNQYMIRNTDEYKDVTKHITGEWEIASHIIGNLDPFKKAFEKGTFSLSFTDRNAKFSFEVTKKYIDSQLDDWKKDYPDLKIDNYRVITKADWYVGKDGERIFFKRISNSVEIEGSGENFAGFFASEQAKYIASENIGKDNGFVGMMLNAATKEVTGTSELFPKIEKNYFLRIASDRESFIMSNGDNKLKLSLPK